jgi:hypothetical protein
MARDILSEYGKDSFQPQAARATSGGVKSARDVMNYATPKGPTNIGDPKGPGLHGDRHGTAHCPVAGRGSGSPGIGGTVHRSGSQK